MKINIYEKIEGANAELIEKIKGYIKKNGHEFSTSNPDLIIYVGGDGTFLRCVDKFHDLVNKTKFVGVKVGHLGYYYDDQFMELDELFDAINNNDFIEQDFHLLKGEIVSDKGTDTIYAVNEIRLENPFRTLITDVFVNKTKLETFRGNGLVVCSPMGSTAYNKSLGGALIDPSVNVMEMTEIAPLSHNINRVLDSPLVVSGDSKITISSSLTGVVIGYDFTIYESDTISKITISSSDCIVKLLRHKSFSYINKLRQSKTTTNVQSLTRLQIKY